jgi:hypothetical protein
MLHGNGFLSSSIRCFPTFAAAIAVVLLGVGFFTLPQHVDGKVFMVGVLLGQTNMNDSQLRQMRYAYNQVKLAVPGHQSPVPPPASFLTCTALLHILCHSFVCVLSSHLNMPMPIFWVP